MSRRKSQAVTAPQTREEAEQLLARYALLAAQIERGDAVVDEAIAAMRGAAIEAKQPIEAELKDIFVRLRSWWAVAGEDVARGRRSVEIAGVDIGVRKTPPSLKLAEGLSEPVGAKRLCDNALAMFVRATPKLDKPAILAALADVGTKTAALLGALGFRAEQKDEFFIALRPMEAAKVEPPPSE